MDTYDDLCKATIEYAWGTAFEQDLSKLDNNKYHVSIAIKYNEAKCEYNVLCECDVTKSLSTYINIPRDVMTRNNLNSFDRYMDLLKENLINKINDIEPNYNYIEIDGVKYYPKENGD